MNYTLSSSFNYTPDVVDFEAMNITDMFPEQSSFSFDMSNSYSDSISGIPLAQQALWDDGQLTLPNSSGSQDGEDIGGGYDVHGDESSGHLAWMDDTKDQQGIMLHYNDQERRDEQHLQFLQDIGAGSLSRGDSISLFDELNDASELSCDLFKEQIDIDETRDQSRLPFEHTYNTHSQFNNAGGHLENEIFDREFMASLNAPPTSSFSPMESANFNNNTQSNIRRNPNNILDGLHSIPAPVLDHDDSINLEQRKHGNRYDGSERSGTGETYQKALKSFFDSLKVADPIKTPHKFAPQPLPILWNEPKIRSKHLPSFNLADYRDIAKATMPLGTPTTLPPFRPTTTTANNATKAPTAFKSTTPLLAATGLSNRLNGTNNRDSFSSSPTNTHSMPNSAHSSPLSSISTSPPSAGIRSKMPVADPKTPTAATYTSKLTYPPTQQDKEPGSPQQNQQQLSPTTSEQRVRSKRRSTILNPHLAFDPTIPPAERAAMEEEAKTPTTPRGTLERRSTLQQAVRSKVPASEDQKSDDDIGANGQQSLQQQGTMGKAMGGLRGPVVRKRRSLHQDMFTNDSGQGIGLNQADQEQQQHRPNEDFVDAARDDQQQQQQQDEALARLGSRPSSMNILPESLTSVNNHAFHQETAKVERVERARRLSEEERHGESSSSHAVAPSSPSAAATPANTRIPAALSLGRTAGARFGRSGSGGAGSLAQMSPTTPTTANPYGSLSGRTATGATAATSAVAGGTVSRLANGAPHRLSLTGTTAAFARQQLDDATAAVSPSTPTQSQYLPKLSQPITTTLSRNGTRSSPPTSAGLRRPGFATQQEDYNGDSGGSALSSPTEQYDDYYHAEKEFQMQQQQQQQSQQPPARSSYLRQQQQKHQQQHQDQEPEWNDSHDEDQQQPRRIPSTPMKSSRTQLPPAPLSPLDQQQQQQREQREQRDQKHLQRLRIQQQALEEVYGHGSGYGNTYPDDQGGFIDDHHRHPQQQQQQQSRYQPQLSPRHQRDDHYRSSMLASPPSPQPPSPRDYLSATATTPKASLHHQQSLYSPPMLSSALPSLTSSMNPPLRASEHYRRQSKDGYSLMSAPRISPPLTALPTSTRTPMSSSQLANPRRSLSQGLSGASTLPSRRLSTAPNVGNDGFGSGSSNIGLHGRSGSSGSSLQRSNTYSAQPLPSTGGGRSVGATGGSAMLSAYSDGNLPSLAGSRRPVSSMMSNGSGSGLPQSSRRSASDSLGSSVRASTNSTSEYARVFNPNPPPPRSSIPSAASGGNHYQQDSYTYRPEVPLRQSSLGAGGGIGGNGGHPGNRSSMASLRSGSSSSSLQGHNGGGPTIASASHLRRAASMNVSATGGGGPNGLGIGMGGGGIGGTGSLGRAGGMMSAATASSRQSSYQPQQQQPHHQMSQQMQMPQQRYQRTSMYSHRP
ncbi:hypothetical protein BGZ96_005973 [Linnemannia gamsii]|uniref:Uncharacterized protein n=1 Tax=Linnemannia gamsii TaxID=64522 RepID=A0ABQ7K3R9_9FUNG|nr:hypothetical protein BGZ96_005973 [Linnemannia gamsii]